MGLFDRIFGSGSASGDKEFKDVKTTTKTTEKGGKTEVRSASTLITGDNKGTHEQVWSKTTMDTKTGSSKYEEGSHGEKWPETKALFDKKR